MGKHRKEQPSLLPPALLLGFAAIPAVLAVVTAQPAPAAVQIVKATTPVLVSVPKPVAVKQQRIPPIIGAKGLTRRAKELAAYLQKTYPDIKEIGGVRACDKYREHCRGIALDIIVGKDTELGDRIALDVLGRDGIQYILWKETYRKPNGISRWMTDRGSVTQNHFDHLHIRVVG